VHWYQPQRSMTLSTVQVSRILLLSMVLLLSCNSTPPSEVDSGVDAGRMRTPRDAGSGGFGGGCINCSLVQGFITGGGFPGGGGGMMMPMGNACEDGGMTGGMGDFPICVPQIFNAFLGCVNAKCSGLCTVPGAPMCLPDGGVPMPADADGGQDGSRCAACITAQCPEEERQCKADM
jgi:hypothetical protein